MSNVNGAQKWSLSLNQTKMKCLVSYAKRNNCSFIFTCIRTNGSRIDDNYTL